MAARQVGRGKILERRGHVVEHAMHLAADQVGGCGGAAFVCTARAVLGLEAGAHLEQLAGHQRQHR